MSVFAFGSVHGAPGVTASVVLLAAVWGEATGRRVLVVEAAPDGGVLAARFEQLRADRTLTDVAAHVRRGFDFERVAASAQELWAGVPVVVAPPSAEQSHSALTAAADRLAAGLGAVEVDVLVDCGRLTPRSPALPFARRAVSAVLVARPSFESAAALAPRVAELAAQGVGVELLAVGDRPYGPANAADAAGVPLVGVLPFDVRAAELFAGGGGSDRRVRRSLLWRSALDVASRLAALVPEPLEDDQPEVASVRGVVRLPGELMSEAAER